jgi:hypothetical protein
MCYDSIAWLLHLYTFLASTRMLFDLSISDESQCDPLGAHCRHRTTFDAVYWSCIFILLHLFLERALGGVLISRRLSVVVFSALAGAYYLYGRNRVWRLISVAL